MSTKTRKQRAEELWQRLQRGPQFGITEAPIAPAEISSRYKGWAQSWILDELAYLVPELRDKLSEYDLANIRRRS